MKRISHRIHDELLQVIDWCHCWQVTYLFLIKPLSVEISFYHTQLITAEEKKGYFVIKM